MAALGLTSNKTGAKKRLKCILSSQQHPQAMMSPHGLGLFVPPGSFRDMLRFSSFWGCLCPSGSGQVGDALIKTQPQLITLDCPSGARAGAGGDPGTSPSSAGLHRDRALSLPSSHTSRDTEGGGSRDGTAPAAPSLPCREHGEAKSPCEGHTSTHAPGL